MKLRMVLPASLALGMLFLGACSDDSDDSVSDDAADVCSNLESLQSTASDALGDVDLADTSREDVENTLDTIQSEVDDLQSSGAELSENVRSELQGAVDDFKSALSEIGDADSLGEAAASLQTARSDLRAAWDAVLAELTCSPTTTGG